jgi:hypothetical protein
VGLGKAGGLPYHYDSFLLRGRSVTDFRKVYDSEQYRDWLSLPILEVVPRGALVPKCIILSSSKNDALSIYVFFSNNKRGLLVQIISFEKGKYSIFKSKKAIFNGEQIKRTILWEIGTSVPVPFVVRAERDAAEHYALRVTRSITVVRDLQKRDQIVLSAGVAILTLEYFLWAFNIIASAESYVGYSILTAFGIIAELSYRRLRDTRIWEKIARKTTAFGARLRQESKT